MRFVYILLAGLVIGAPAEAQERQSSEGSIAEAQVPSPLEASDTNLPPTATLPSQAAVADQFAAQPGVLDGAFWRQVLAGVVVTVVSTLILRAIL